MRIPARLAGVALAGIALLGIALLGIAALGLGGVAAAAPAEPPAAPPNTVTGVGVGAGNTNIDWAKLKAEGVEFAYVQDTSGNMTDNPLFTEQYNGARGAGMLVGAVHFALPNASSGATQADYFLANGGGWAANKDILPPVVDLEWNPFGAMSCYGLSSAAMVNWINQFVTEVHTKTTRWPVIYTDTAWWSECTGNLHGFASTDPLWTTQPAAGSAVLPYDWTAATFVSVPTDSLRAYYNGTLADLTKLANQN